MQLEVDGRTEFAHCSQSAGIVKGQRAECRAAGVRDKRNRCFAIEFGNDRHCLSAAGVNSGEEGVERFSAEVDRPKARLAFRRLRRLWADACGGASAEQRLRPKAKGACAAELPAEEFAVELSGNIRLRGAELQPDGLSRLSSVVSHPAIVAGKAVVVSRGP